MYSVRSISPSTTRDPVRTPMRLGIVVTALNLVFNVILIPGLGPIPALGTAGALRVVEVDARLAVKPRLNAAAAGHDLVLVPVARLNVLVA